MAKGVVTSLHNAEVDRCVDIVKRLDGTFTFAEFRRDVEDGGSWTLVDEHGRPCFTNEQDAMAAAKKAVTWLRNQQPLAQPRRAIEPSVIATLHNEHADRGVKIVKRSEGAFGFQEFRRDPEDAGGWTLVSDASRAAYATQEQARDAARASIPWLARMSRDSGEEKP
jgi:hypothetical protein